MTSSGRTVISALLVRARSRVAALPVLSVVETFRPRPVEPVAGAPPFVLGLAVVRGAPAPVVDLGALLGAEGPRETRRFVTVRCGARMTALAVEAVLDVRALDEAALDALPPVLGAGGAAVSRLGALDRELLVLLEATRILPDETWDRLVGAREVRS